MQLKSLVFSLLKEGYFVVCCGGDHSMAVGSISAARAFKRQTRVCWVDAHADVNTEKTSPSGNIHGMPVAILAGLSEKLGAQFRCISLSSDLVYVGVRDTDPGERDVIQKH